MIKTKKFNWRKKGHRQFTDREFTIHIFREIYIEIGSLFCLSSFIVGLPTPLNKQGNS